MITPAARLAADYVAEFFPAARAALLAGSIETTHDSATSDLDIVIINGSEEQAFRRTARHAGHVVEAFVHTPASLQAFIDREVTTRRSPLMHMCAEGRLILDSDGL